MIARLEATPREHAGLLSDIRPKWGWLFFRFSRSTMTGFSLRDACFLVGG
jgi:hypothetical protein